MNEKGVDSSKDEIIKEESKEEFKKESKAEVQEESKEEESTRKRKLDFKNEMPEAFDRLDWNIMSWKLHSSSGVHTLVTETGLVIHMLVEKKYPLRKEVLVQMLKLKLESEEDSTMALELIRLIKKITCRVRT
ncbi:hypothetical protein Tco_0320632 [Tanacetum coccineum]